MLESFRSIPDCFRDLKMPKIEDNPGPKRGLKPKPKPEPKDPPPYYQRDPLERVTVKK